MPNEDTAMSSLQILEAGLSAGYQQKLARAILGHDSPAELHGFLVSVAQTHLGWADVECFHFELSVGAVFGLANGTDRCLLKVWSSDAELADLQAQARFQRYVTAMGFPAPPVILDPTPHAGAVIAIEHYCDKGRRADGHIQGDRKLIAGSLAELIAIGEQYPEQEELPRQLLQDVDGSPWPKPHNVLFDFPATAQGAEWIDEVGWRFKDLLENSGQPLKVGHMDWAAKHFRIEDGRVSAVYDWDSVGRFPETRIVAQAAASFMTSWYVASSNRPTMKELRDFLNHYQTARGKRFSTEQCATLVGSLLYAAGYSARCEYAIKSAAGRTENCEFLAMLLDGDLESQIGRLCISASYPGRA